MNQVLDRYAQLGATRFSEELCTAIHPFLQAIHPHVPALRRGFAEMHMRGADGGARVNLSDGKRMLSPHAQAMLAGACACLMVDASVAEGLTTRIKTVCAEQLATCSNGVRAEADGSAIDWDQPGEHSFTVQVITDGDARPVMRAQCTVIIE